MQEARRPAQPWDEGWIVRWMLCGAGIGATQEEAVDVGARPAPVVSFKVSKPGTESLIRLWQHACGTFPLVSPIVAASHFERKPKGRQCTVLQLNLEAILFRKQTSSTADPSVARCRRRGYKTRTRGER